MAGRIDFRKIETPTEFQQLCERLLARIFPEFHPVNQAGGDAGVDGFVTWGDQFFQFTHTQANVPLRKVRADIEKVKRFQGLRRWHFLCSRPLSASTWRFIEAQRTACPFEIVVWDGARLADSLSVCPDLVNEFFPEFAKKAYEGTKAIREDIKGLRKAVTRAKRRPPKAGDAPEGLDIDGSERQDIYDLIMQIAEEEAHRRHAKDAAFFIRDRWRQFNGRYQLSSYDRLPKAKFGDAISTLRTWLFSARNNEPGYLKIERERKTIYAIANRLGWSEEQRRDLYASLTGKQHLGEMSRPEIQKVCRAMRRYQDAAM